MSPPEKASPTIWEGTLLTKGKKSGGIAPSSLMADKTRQRAFTCQPATLVLDYQEDSAYIEQRRL